jgi:hypothetical protein
LIHRGSGTDGVGNSVSGNEAARCALSKLGFFGKVAQPAAFRQRNERRPQHGTPDSDGIKLPWTSIGINNIFYHSLREGTSDDGVHRNKYLLVTSAISERRGASALSGGA